MAEQLAMAKRWAVIAKDGPGGTERRANLRQAHFTHIEAAMDRIAIAGPLSDDQGAMTGSLFVIKAASRAEAEALFKADPYFTGDVWDHWELHPFLAAAGEWVGGKIW